jgi:3-deoxy-manno-octulosonate cytidylyltransferase (CMP-KDO synthetase)
LNLPKCYGIIPARYSSRRFKGKPLAQIMGKPMFWHVYSQACLCAELSEIVLATDDERIFKAAINLNVPVVMTRNNHISGTDRVLEAALGMGIPENAVVINIQGDEPALEPSMLSQIVAPFISPEVMVSTLARKINSEEAVNQDRVKVVFARDGKALYFSRSPIPYYREKNKQAEYYGHIGLYAFRMDILKKFVELGPGRLEKIEKLEQLRFLENGITIHVVVTEYESIGVDRPEDLAIVSRILSMKRN